MNRRFTVIWARELEHDYTARWLAADRTERKRLTEIANRIDRGLRLAADMYGAPVRSRPSYRVWQIPDILPPGVASYEVRPDDRITNLMEIRFLSE
jgi:hypothetical protein